MWGPYMRSDRNMEQMGWIYGIAVFAALSVAGCAGGQKNIAAQMENNQQEVWTPPAERPAEGSIWQENGLLGGLFMDPKARRVGDIVTVSIVESSAATNDADTKTERESSIAARVESFLGIEKGYPTGGNPNWNPFGSIKAGMQNDFDGSGTTKRSGKMAASMTARVVGILPNGNLKIIGTRAVTVNNETQLITLSGIIRPRDISPDNVILSTYIADAQISYTGDGIVNEKQRPGWLARIFDVVWPF